jgi:hypothetical protein
MLHDPARHEALTATRWNEGRARDAIERIVGDAEARFSPEGWWPSHPRDDLPPDVAVPPATPLYFGAAGMAWALRYLRGAGAARLHRDHDYPDPDELIRRNGEWLHAAELDDSNAGSYLCGATSILLMAYGLDPSEALADRLAALIEGQIAHPARELMWGSPGTLLAARFLHERDGDARWAELFRRTAAQLWCELEWSPAHSCRYWTQDLYGRRSTFLDAVHGFVATASVLVQGRHLLDAESWRAWQTCITETVQRTATREGDGATWRAELLPLDPSGVDKKRMQFCHGAPGFVVCLADMPDDELDALLLAAGRATWAAGPLALGASLCHGTGGNGYAFLKLFRRSGDSLWLDRARAYAAHGIEQLDAEAPRVGRRRYSLWTGDIGFAIYLWDCVRATARFPTLDVFWNDSAAT